MMIKQILIGTTILLCTVSAMASPGYKIANNASQGYSTLEVNIQPGETLIFDAQTQGVFQKYLFSVSGNGGSCSGSFRSGGSKVVLTYQAGQPNKRCVISSHMGGQYQAPGIFSVTTNGSKGAERYPFEIKTKKVTVQPGYPAIPVPFISAG